ncbi:ECF transporter S component [Alkaliphilus transvaalensis]|uniref:ECF transporter S component n=1 Tax=Alkaliphilus transvaalensis TaxID=114628 RepID=UPI00047C9041|nr:ECF transporter S component [Alkaliphilus transvaalensis]
MQNTSNVFSMEKKKRISTKTLVKISILAVLAYVLMLLELPIPIFPTFLKIDLSDVPALVGGFALGPVAGVFIQLIKVLLHFITNSSTGGVGSLANFIVGSAYVVPASIIYHRKKDKVHALLGVIAGTISMCIVGVIANIYILIPFYSNFMPIEAIVNMGTVVNRNIVDVRTLVLYGVTPFNLVKGIVIGLVTMLIYKKVSPIIKNN